MERLGLLSPIYRGLHSDLLSFLRACKAFGWLLSPIYRGLHSDNNIQVTKPFSTCCYPLFIAGCIRTAKTSSKPQKDTNVAIPYLSRVAFGPPRRCRKGRLSRKLLSPIYRGLHSDLEYTVAPFRSASCYPLFIAGCIRTVV